MRQLDNYGSLSNTVAQIRSLSRNFCLHKEIALQNALRHLQLCSAQYSQVFFLNLKVKIEFLGSSCCLPLLRCRLKAGELSGVRNFRCIDLEMACFGDLKACPHCRRKVRLSPLSRSFLRQSHFSATVWTGLNAKVIPKWVLLKSAPVTSPLLLNEWWSEALSILSQKTATVAEFGDSLTFLRQYGQGLRQLSPKSRSAVEKTAEIDTNTNHSKGDSGNYHTGSFSPLCGHLRIAGSALSSYSARATRQRRPGIIAVRPQRKRDVPAMADISDSWSVTSGEKQSSWQMVEICIKPV